jgi:hypothetical protein
MEPTTNLLMSHIQNSFEMAGRSFKFTFSSAMLSSLTKPTTPAKNVSLEIKIVSNSMENDNDMSLSSSSYAPSELEEDSISIPPSPSPYARHSLPPTSSSSSILDHMGQTSTPAREATPDSWMPGS